MDKEEYRIWLKRLRKGSNVIVDSPWLDDTRRFATSVVERIYIGKHIQHIHVKGFGAFDREGGCSTLGRLLCSLKEDA